MTITPERLEELRYRNADMKCCQGLTIMVTTGDADALIQAADALNALLAAAEGCLHNYEVDVKEGSFYMEQEHDQFDILRAAIRRAKGEKP